MHNEIMVIEQSLLTCVSGGDGEDDYSWQDITFNLGVVEFNIGQLNDLGSDFGSWLYDFLHS